MKNCKPFSTVPVTGQIQKTVKKKKTTKLKM